MITPRTDRAPRPIDLSAGSDIAAVLDLAQRPAWHADAALSLIHI